MYRNKKAGTVGIIITIIILIIDSHFFKWRK